MTDGHADDRTIKNNLPHRMIDHSLSYVAGDIHAQNIEKYWSIFKRGVCGVFQHVSEGRRPSYLHEFDFRRNPGKISDAKRFSALIS